MCGIVGVRAETLNRARGDFAAALAALRWRGPDGLAQVTHGGWHLGIARLAITDVAAPQPIACATTARQIVFNGAVTSAASEWLRFGEGRRTRNDAELPLLRWRHAGVDQVAPRCGHHAFAIVGSDGDGVLARDRFGEKPLYVVRAGGRVVAFASTVAALRRLGFAVQLPATEQARFFHFGWHATPMLQQADATLDDALDDALVGVIRLRDGAPVPQRAEATSPLDLRARLRAAVQRCAHAEVEVGLALSGGLDSACLAACLPERRGPGWLAYQFCAVGEPEAERALARVVATRFALQLREVDGDARVLRALPELTAALGLPVGDPSTLAAHAVARAAAADGVRVLLSGEGGDELLFGYRRHRAARFLPRRGCAWLPGPPACAHGYAARLWRALTARQPYPTLLHAAAPGVLQRALVAELRADPLVTLAAGDGLQAAIAFDRDEYLRRDLLPKLDLATLAAGLEGRCPFLDPDVVAAPETQLAAARSGLGKRALRRAFAEQLPHAVLRQRKTGFGLPLDRWLREDDFLADVLRDRRSRERPHVLGAGLARVLDDHRAGRLAAGHTLYLFAAFEFYLRTLET